MTARALSRAAPDSPSTSVLLSRTHRSVEPLLTAARVIDELLAALER